MLLKNKQTASRNAKRQYLLTGLVKCAECGCAYIGHQTNKRHTKGKKTKRKTPITTYHCSSRQNHCTSTESTCSQGKVGGKTLETAVWHTACTILLEPRHLVNALDCYFSNDENEQALKQITYLEQKILARQQEDERVYRAYIAGAFDEYEFASQRQVIKDIITNFKQEIATLQSRILSPQQVEAQKLLVMQIADEMQQIYLLDKVPFEKKQRILKMVVDRIELCQGEKWFKMEGAISGVYPLSAVLTEKQPTEDDKSIVGGNSVTDRVPENIQNDLIVDNTKRSLDLLAVYLVLYSLASNKPLSGFDLAK